MFCILSYTVYTLDRYWSTPEHSVHTFGNHLLVNNARGDTVRRPGKATTTNSVYWTFTETHGVGLVSPSPGITRETGTSTYVLKVDSNGGR